MTIHRKPTMQATDESRRRAIGSYMYLWTQRPGSCSNKVIISTHGAVTTSGVTAFDVISPEVFHFYSAQGEMAKGYSLTSASYGTGSSERIDQGRCPNYDLSKFQGYHAGSEGKNVETYATIQQLQANKDEADAMFNAAFKDPKFDRRKLGVPWNEGDSRPDFDVLTVRNRFWASGVTLEYAVKQLRGIHTYHEIHCAFCRVA